MILLPNAVLSIQAFPDAVFKWSKT